MIGSCLTNPTGAHFSADSAHAPRCHFNFSSQHAVLLYFKKTLGTLYIQHCVLLCCKHWLPIFLFCTPPHSPEYLISMFSYLIVRCKNIYKLPPPAPHTCFEKITISVKSLVSSLLKDTLCPVLPPCFAL